ncbi:MAG: BPL-N domain-containing protein [Caldimicrobium sp.]
MKENILKNSKVALLISDSHLWGIWFYKALKEANLSFDPILANQIDNNFPHKYCGLFVPGGWSKNKLDALNNEQHGIIKSFIKNGGLYFGICGGASLAGVEGLSLITVRRKKERIPSYSGPSIVNFNCKVLFNNIKKPIFYLWFPPEWEIKEKKIKILATFSQPLLSAYTSDLCLGDHYKYLNHYEKLYGIPLNPNKMKDKVLFIEGNYGKGKVFLSLIHFDTPSCPNSKIFWKNFITYYNLPISSKVKNSLLTSSPASSALTKNLLRRVQNLYKMVQNLLHFGVRNFLFHKRYSFFYQWKRGIRGLELLNLYYMFKEIIFNLNTNPYPLETLDKIMIVIEKLEERLPIVLEGLKKDMYGYLSKEKLLEENEERKIFGAHVKSYGGIYREIINDLEKVLVYLWQSM